MDADVDVGVVTVVGRESDDEFGVAAGREQDEVGIIAGTAAQVAVVVVVNAAAAAGVCAYRAITAASVPEAVTRTGMGVRGLSLPRSTSNTSPSLTADVYSNRRYLVSDKISAVFLSLRRSEHSGVTH